MSSARERRARARQTGVSAARPSPQRKPSPSPAAAPRTAAPQRGVAQALGRPPQGQGLHSGMTSAPTSVSARLREGWDRPRICLEAHEALGRQQVFGEKAVSVEQATEFARRRRAAERATAERAAAGSAHAATRAAVIREPGWAKIDLAVERLAADHKVPLLSQQGQHRSTQGAGY